MGTCAIGGAELKKLDQKSGLLRKSVLKTLLKIAVHLMLTALLTMGMLSVLNRYIYPEPFFEDRNLVEDIGENMEPGYGEDELRGFSERMLIVSKDGDVRELGGIEKLEELSQLWLVDASSIRDFAPIAKMKSLEILFIGGVDLDKFSKAGEFSSLKHLKINDFINGSGLDGSDYPSLESLELSKVKLENLNGFKNMGKIQTLFLRDLEIDRMDGVENMESLKFIDIRNVKIKDSSSINRLENLEDIYIVDSQVEGVERLQGNSNFNVEIENSIEKER